MSDPRRYRLEASFRSVPLPGEDSGREGGGAMLAATTAIRAMSLGRVDADSAVNLASIEGIGSERAAIALDVLSTIPERGEELVGEVLDVLHEAANAPECPCDLRVRIEEPPAEPEPAAPQLLDTRA